MARPRKDATGTVVAAETPDAPPTPEERQGKRGHDEHGNVRPADGRWELHDPEDESKVVRTEAAH